MSGKKRKKRRGSRRENRRVRSRIGSQDSSIPTVDNILQMVSGDLPPQLGIEIFEGALEEWEAIPAAERPGNAEFWSQPKGQFYLKAHLVTGICLYRMNQIEEAAEYFEKVVALYAADPHGARYWLAACLLTLDCAEQASRLLGRFDEKTAISRYLQSLAAFAVRGDCEQSCRYLKEAQELNPRVLDYVLDDQVVRADESLPLDLRKGDAHSIARILLPAWRSIPGSVRWARRVLHMHIPVGKKRPVSFPRKQLRSLPRVDGAWQLGLRRLSPTSDDATPGWIMAVADVESQVIRLVTVLEGTPTPDDVWEALLGAFLHPMEGRPERPQRLEVLDDELARQWREPLSTLKVQCARVQPPQPVLHFLEVISDQAESRRLPELEDGFDLDNLPAGDAVWQVDFFHQPLFVSDENGEHRPWAVIVVEKHSNVILATEFVEGPIVELLWEYLERTMMQQSLRPKRVEVRDSDSYDLLHPMLNAVGVECVLQDDLPELHQFCFRLAASFREPQKLAMAEGSDVDEEVLERLFDAAAYYYRRAPWRHVPGELPIQWRTEDQGTRYALVLGKTGVTLGLALFEDQDEVFRLIAGESSVDEVDALVLLYDEEFMMAPEDLYLLEYHGWSIAGPEAYPFAIRCRPGKPSASPTAEELELLTQCLNLIPDFVIDSSRQAKEEQFSRSSFGERSNRRSTRKGKKQPSSGEDTRASTAVEYVNRRGHTYYLHQGRTKTGKPKYFFSKKAEGVLCDRMPEGFEIYENPRGQVFCRRIQPKLIQDDEIQCVQNALRASGKTFFTQVDVKKKDIIVYEREHPCLKFSLEDEEKRMFTAFRWCFRGSIDDWIPVGFDERPLADLAEAYCEHIGEESYFDLM